MVLNGKQIFQLMDSKGLPLEIINECLREKQSGFNVIEFTEAALDSKNFTYPKIKCRLLDAMEADKTTRAEFEIELDKIKKEV